MIANVSYIHWLWILIFSGYGDVPQHQGLHVVEICAGSGRIASTANEYGLNSFAMDVARLYTSNVSCINASIQSLTVCRLGPVQPAPRSYAAGWNAAADAGCAKDGSIQPSLDPGLHLN